MTEENTAIDFIIDALVTRPELVQHIALLTAHRLKNIGKFMLVLISVFSNTIKPFKTPKTSSAHMLLAMWCEMQK